MGSALALARGFARWHGDGRLLLLPGKDFLDQSRKIVGEDAAAVAATPRGLFDLHVVPIDAPAGASELQPSAAVALNNPYVIGPNRKVHLALPDDG